MTDRELMQQALEVLERCPALYRAPEAATALRERLAQTAAIALAHKVKVYEDALGEIAWSNDSEWQQARAKQVLAQMRGVEL